VSSIPAAAKALLAGGQAVGFGDVGHLVEMVEAGFGDVERRRHVEDRPPVLDGGDAAGRERAAVADPIDLVQHRHVGVARPQEVGVERVHGPVVVDGARRRDECLAGDLATEDPLSLLVGVHPTEDVDLDGFEVEEIDERVDVVLGHLHKHGRSGGSVGGGAGLTERPWRVRQGGVAVASLP
jgi:hypothetical protein